MTWSSSTGQSLGAAITISFYLRGKPCFLHHWKAFSVSFPTPFPQWGGAQRRSRNSVAMNLVHCENSSNRAAVPAQHELEQKYCSLASKANYLRRRSQQKFTKLPYLFSNNRQDQNTFYLVPDRNFLERGKSSPPEFFPQNSLCFLH